MRAHTKTPAFLLGAKTILQSCVGYCLRLSLQAGDIDIQADSTDRERIFYLVRRVSTNEREFARAGYIFRLQMER